MSPYAAPVHLTSVPTSRNAYQDTRRWLLAEYGARCAYCGGAFPADVLTLDHVTPRRGRTAYDRRDNLVLSCSPCNGAKRDLPLLAFLLLDRQRAGHMLSRSAHLSPMLLEIIRDLARPAAIAAVTAPAAWPDPWAEVDDDVSPYRD